MRTPPINPNPTPSAPAAPVADWLLRTNNLGDVVNPAAARTNLGLGTAAVLNVPAVPATAAAANQIVRGDDPRVTEASSLAALKAYLESGQMFRLPNFPSTVWGVAATKDATAEHGAFCTGIRRTNATNAYQAIYQQAGNALFNRGSLREYLNFAKPLMLCFRMAQIAAGASANTTMRVTFGKIPADANGALTRRGIGVLILNNLLYGICKNGGAQTIGAVGTALTIDVVYDIKVLSNGAGLVGVYVNDVLVETLTGGPTTELNVAACLMVEADNAASSDYFHLGVTNLIVIPAN